MKAYISYFKLKFITGLQYRSAAWAGVATQFFFGVVYIMVCVAFYESGSKSLPMSLPQFTTYIWLIQTIFALVNQFYKDEELFNIIKNGNISYELLRPKNMYFMWYFKILGQRLSNVVIRFLPLVLVTTLLPSPYNFGLPNSFMCFIMFIVSLFLGALLINAITVLYPIITLTSLNEKGIVNIIIVIADILSGVIVPIPFFSKFFQVFSKCLPFQYVSDLPFRIYVGNINISSCFGMVLMQLIWIIILVLFGYFLMKKNLRRVEVQGG